MNIIRLTPQHAGTYRALMLEAYAMHLDAFTSSVAERSALPLAWWQARLAEGDTPHEMVFGGWVGPELAGAVGLGFEQREKLQHKASLFGMYVPARFRQSGLGGQLLRHALACAKARPGVALVQLTVTHGNRAAEALYERHGFVRFGLEPCAVGVAAGYVAKSHMWHPLKDIASGPLG